MVVAGVKEIAYREVKSRFMTSLTGAEISIFLIADFGHLGLSVLYRCLYLSYLSTNLHSSA